MSYKEINMQSFTEIMCIRHRAALCSYVEWAAQKGTTVPHIWQPPQTTQLAAGIWPNC